MRLDYTTLISEPAEELAAMERRYRGSQLQPRLTMLRLLKAGIYPSRRQVAKQLNYSERQLDRWFVLYREGGLGALLEKKTTGGSDEYVTDEAWQALEEKMKRGEIARLEDARLYLGEEHAIWYSGIQSISQLFKRRGVKRKTGRRRHLRASAEEQAAFKK